MGREGRKHRGSGREVEERLEEIGEEEKKGIGRERERGGGRERRGGGGEEGGRGPIKLILRKTRD